MNAIEIIAEVEKAGAALSLDNGQARLRGAKIPTELLALVKANRDALIKELEGRALEAQKDRGYGVTPAANASKCGAGFELAEKMRETVLVYAGRQPEGVQLWARERSRDYFRKGMPANDCLWRACVDAVAWQRNTGPRAAMEWLEGIEESWASFPKCGAAGAECGREKP